jgi:hypothetical protein
MTRQPEIYCSRRECATNNPRTSDRCPRCRELIAAMAAVKLAHLRAFVDAACPAAGMAR